MSGAVFFNVDFGDRVPGISDLDATGTSASNPYLLTRKVSVFQTVPAGSYAGLPSSYASGTALQVFNFGASTLNIAPPAADQIYNLGIGAFYALAPRAEATFISFDPPTQTSPRTWWLVAPLQAQNNLSEIANAATALANLGISLPLPVASGGTGLSSVPTNGQLLIGNGTGYTLGAPTGTANNLIVTTGSGSITLQASAKQIPGTATNDTASAGNLGEYISASVPGSSSTVTITIATPGVVTWTGNVLPANAPVQFTTSGALPTGLAIGTTYYVVGSSITTNTFELATSVANAIAGTAINTTGTQSGTQTAYSKAYLGSGTAADIAAVSLTAGDWDVRGSVSFAPAGSTTVTLVEGWINTASATLPSAPNGGAITTVAATLTTGAAQNLHVGMTRLSLASTTTVFLSAQSSFGTSTMSAFGFLGARRVR